MNATLKHQAVFCCPGCGDERTENVTLTPGDLQRLKFDPPHCTVCRVPMSLARIVHVVSASEVRG